MNTFKQAHALTRLVIQSGDNYQATFTLCLRAVIADSKQVLATQYNTVFEAINYHAPTYNNVPFAKPQAQWNTANPIVKAVQSLDASKVVGAIGCLLMLTLPVWLVTL